MEPSEVVAQLWSRVQARDWVGVGDLLAEGFVLEWPHDLVRLRGRANFVEFNRSYPEGWSIEVLRIVSEGNTVVSEVRVPHPTVGPYYALSFYEVDDSRSHRRVNTGSWRHTRNRGPSALAGSSQCEATPIGNASRRMMVRCASVRECPPSVSLVPAEFVYLPG